MNPEMLFRAVVLGYDIESGDNRQPFEFLGEAGSAGGSAGVFASTKAGSGPPSVQITEDAIIFDCATCHRGLHVSRNDQRAEVVCGHCQTINRVPSPSEAELRRPEVERPRRCTKRQKGQLVIVTHCPSCGMNVGFRLQHAGRTMECPSCLHPVRVPLTKGPSQLERRFGQASEQAPRDQQLTSMDQAG